MSGHMFELHCGDAVEWLKSLDDESADLIVCDPAYSSLEKHRAKGTTTRLKVSDGSSNKWFPVVPNDYFTPFLTECYRVLTRNAHCYILSDQETAHVIKPIGEEVGFKWWKGLIWVKSKVGLEEPSVGMGYHYRASHEIVTFFEKGKRRLADLSTPDVLYVPKVRDGFPTEKPVDLLKVLVRQSTNPGEVVIDPFMGSASTGEATLALERHFRGNDIQERAVSVARTRLARFGTEIT